MDVTTPIRMRRKPYCGKAAVPYNRRRGSPYECFKIGYSVGLAVKRPRKPTTGLRSIPGIGVRFERRLIEEYDIRTPQQLVNRVRRINGERRRREFLKKVFRGFENRRRVVRTSFSRVRNYLIQQGVQVRDMTR